MFYDRPVCFNLFEINIHYGDVLFTHIPTWKFIQPDIMSEISLPYVSMSAENRFNFADVGYPTTLLGMVDLFCLTRGQNRQVYIQYGMV